MVKTPGKCASCDRGFPSKKLWNTHKASTIACKDAEFIAKPKNPATDMATPHNANPANPAEQTPIPVPGTTETEQPADAEVVVLAAMENDHANDHGEAPALHIPDDDDADIEGSSKRKRTPRVNTNPKFMYSSTMPDDMQFNIMQAPSFHLGSVGPAPLPPVKPTTDRSIVMIPVGRITDAARPYKRDRVWIERAGSMAYARLEVDNESPEVEYQFVDTTGTYIAGKHIWFEHCFLTNDGTINDDELIKTTSAAHNRHVQWHEEEMTKYTPAQAKYQNELILYQATITANMAWTEEGDWRHHDGPARVLLLGGIDSDTEDLTPLAFNRIVKELVRLAKAKTNKPNTRRTRRKLGAALAFTDTIPNEDDNDDAAN